LGRDKRLSALTHICNRLWHPVVQEIVQELFLREIPSTLLGDQVTMMMSVLIGWMSQMRQRHAFFAMDQLAAHADQLLRVIAKLGRFEFHQPEQVTMFKHRLAVADGGLGVTRLPRDRAVLERRLLDTVGGSLLVTGRIPELARRPAERVPRVADLAPYDVGRRLVHDHAAIELLPHAAVRLRLHVADRRSKVFLCLVVKGLVLRENRPGRHNGAL
jgi:hypothetical protein